MEQIFVNAKMMLYKTTRTMVHSSDCDTDVFDIVTAVLQGAASVLYMLLICLDWVLRMSIDLIKENGFTQTKGQESDDIPQKLTDADDADDQALLTYTPVSTDSLLYRLGKATGSIAIYFNAKKQTSCVLWIHRMGTNKMQREREKSSWEIRKNASYFLRQILEAIPFYSCMATCLSSYK